MSDAPGYERRELGFTESTVVFQASPWDRYLHEIERVETQPGQNGSTHYSIFYRDAGEPWPLRLVHRTGPGESLQIENRSAVWRRVQDDLETSR